MYQSPMPSAQRMKLNKRPSVRLHDARSDDHDIFGAEGRPVETPGKGKRVVDMPIGVSQDESIMRTGRRRVSPRHSTDMSKGFAGDNYDPAVADRFQNSRRYASSGNILCGGSQPDSFETKKPSKEVTGKRNSSVDLLAHTCDDPALHVKSRPATDTARRHMGQQCPFAVDDGVAPPEQRVKALHPSNIHHGDVLTGGKMEAQFAGRRL
eukprot:TRINITY_DN14630_c0_g2_i1.p1 TRINITY_DN14630_c0_g2~~TRINITY_DN14630_c0_g2_i1.p1  ORF type:complete len:209 (+),score=56.31 TRINITY_DN14630_c0_g2_i1:67-693(+)